MPTESKVRAEIEKYQQGGQRFLTVPEQGRTIIESMFRMETPRAVIRVWRQETEILDDYDNTDIAQAVNKIVPVLHTPSRLIPLIAALPRVNAVEVLRNNGRADDGRPHPGGDGVVFYNNWP